MNLSCREKVVENIMEYCVDVSKTCNEDNMTIELTKYGAKEIVTIVMPETVWVDLKHKVDRLRSHVGKNANIVNEHIKKAEKEAHEKRVMATWKRPPNE